MKSELKLSAHSVLSGQNVIEIWHDGELMGTVTGADEPGVRIFSKHKIVASRETVPGSQAPVTIVKVAIQP